MFLAQRLLSLVLRRKKLRKCPRGIVTCFCLVVGLELEPKAAESLPSYLFCCCPDTEELILAGEG